MIANRLVVTLVISTIGRRSSTASNSAPTTAAVGPYSIVFDTLGNCASDAYKTDGSMLLYGRIHHNRTVKGHVYSGNLTINRDLNFGDAMGQLELAKWDSVSGWRENFFVMSMSDVCHVMATIVKPLMLHLQQYIRNFPASCPLRKGLYIINNVPARAGAIEKFPIMPYFRFRGYAIMSYKNGRK